MTEDEAKTKWCPFTRVCGAGNVTDMEWHTNRTSFFDAGEDGFDLCVASACMAWREDMAMFVRATGERTEPETAYAADALERKPIGGHCGLAGRP